MKIGIADFECNGVKNAKTGTDSLFTGAEFLAILPAQTSE
jgi:hypothetical protein